MAQLNEAVGRSGQTGAAFLSVANADGTAIGSLAPVADSTLAPTSYKNAGLVTKANIKNAAGAVFSLYITNINSAIRYFQLHNKATAPAGADTAQQSWIIPGGTANQPAVLILDADYFATQEYFATGIGWAISTTDTTFTDSATAGDHAINVRYI